MDGAYIKMMNYLLMIALLAFTSCAKLPEMLAPQAQRSVNIPAQYGVKSYEPLEVSAGLKSLFSGDALLSGYIAQTLRHNPDLQESFALLEEAGYDLKVASSGKFPTVAWNSSATRTQGIIGSNSFLATILSSELDASWELDVWGRIKAGIQASIFDEAAVKADFMAAQESLVAQTIQAYFSLLASNKLVGVAQRELESLSDTYRSTERRFESGTGALSEVELARSDQANSLADLEAAKDVRDQASRALAVLTGHAPRLLNSSEEFPHFKRTISAGLPSDLLKKRPDIQAAYLRILAADERIKVAHADLFPSISLTGRYGRQSSALSDLLSGRAWSFGGNIAAPVFDAGALQAELGASSARSKSALAGYRSTVIQALEEVENALGSEQYLRKQEKATQSALSSAKKAEERIYKQYESGLTELPTLLETQRRVFDTEISLVNIMLQRHQNRVDLALALGKGV